MFTDECSKESLRKDFCLWYYAQGQPLDANNVFEWFKNCATETNADLGVQREIVGDLLKENERLINFNIHLQETSAKYVWHPASTPPKHNGDVIAVLSDGTFFMARHNNLSGWGFYFLDNGLQFDDTLGRNVTHWMPLSSLPSI